MNNEQNFTVFLPKAAAGRKVSPEVIAAIKNLPLATITKGEDGTLVTAPKISSGPSAIEISYTQRASYTRAAKLADEEIKFVLDRNDETKKNLFVFRVSKGTIKPRITNKNKTASN